MSDDLTQPDNPDFAALRGRLRGQWKAQRRAEEREAVQEHWAQRDLISAVTEAMHRGEHVTITVPSERMLTGVIIATGRDYAVLRTSQHPRRDFAVRLTDADQRRAGDPYAGPQVLITVAEGGSTEEPVKSLDAPATFQAVLQQYDFEQQVDPGREVEIGTTFHPRGLVCQLCAYAWDHLYVLQEDGDRVFIPIGALIYIAWASHNTRFGN